jgi:hypothetical protein
MPTRQQVWTAADRIRGRSERVSLRSVRAELPRGGSYRDIGEHLASWKAERSYHPKIELAKLPEFLQSSLATFGKALWEAAMQEATRQFIADRERFEGILKDERALREQALMAADLLEERVAKLTAENRSLSLERELDRQEKPDNRMSEVAL